MASGDYGLREIKLPVEFERARLNRQSARGGSWLGGLVDNTHLDAELGQPKRQHQTRRARTDDQDIGLRHVFLRLRASRWSEWALCDVPRGQ